MLDIRILMNSSVEEIIGFKCCSLQDQNLEIHLINKGDRPLEVLPGFVLSHGQEQKKITNVYPPGNVGVPPGEAAAIYCSMDEIVWDRFSRITFEDARGKAHTFPTRP